VTFPAAFDVKEDSLLDFLSDPDAATKLGAVAEATVGRPVLQFLAGTGTVTTVPALLEWGRATIEDLLHVGVSLAALKAIFRLVGEPWPGKTEGPETDPIEEAPEVPRA